SWADILAGCIDTSASDSQQCTELSACSTPGSTFSGGACTNPLATGGRVIGVPQVDTLGAIANIARNPAIVAVDGLFASMPPQVPFSPVLAAAPHDWSMPVTYPGFNQPWGVAIDSQGNVWVANRRGDSVSTIKADAVTTLDNTTGANFTAPTGVAIDSSDRVWITNQGS